VSGGESEQQGCRSSSGETIGVVAAQQEAMMMDDLDYYWRRMGEEEREAARSERSDVRSVHEKLAAMYEARIRQLSGASDRIVPIRADAPMRAAASGQR
jgi:hypothetical protein